ncbi:sensor histidine kinase [Chitinophaga sp. Hz27]|uniref:sensor histidine kinase n=1 Tax=Chitinophaga sp. Hz27 TaxID=3347169 RepID=UPI0035D6F49E
MSFVNNLKKYNSVLIHALAWTVYLSLGTFKNFFTRDGYHVNVIDIIVTALPSVIIFYGHYFILDKLLDKNKKKNKWFLPLAEIGLFAVCVGIYYLDGYVLASIINADDKVPAFRFTGLVVGTFWVYLVYAIYSSGYYFAIQAVRREKQLRNVELQHLKIEQDRLQSEYAFLRAQINPHFLHNTLNFFYAKSLSCSAELSEGILTLSDIMRYSLENNESENGTVSLAKEVEHLKNVIKINQLRFSNKLHLDFVTKGDIGSMRIIPLVLITLVENAFKHGDLTDPQSPVKLYLEISEDRTQLKFTTYNKRKTGPKELSHGIGIENIRKRLNWTYPQQYTFETGNATDNGDFYFAALTIYFQAANGSENLTTAQASDEPVNLKYTLL